MPGFSSRIDCQKGRENVKMPYLVKKCVRKSMGKNMISCYCLKVGGLDLSQSY